MTALYRPVVKTFDKSRVNNFRMRDLSLGKYLTFNFYIYIKMDVEYQ